MAANSWQKINLNTFESVWTPLDQRPTSDSPAGNIWGFSGATWDSTRGNLLIWGGDIGNEQGNEVYIFGANTGLWSRGSLPSQVTATNGIEHTVDGIYNSPLSGESWDNVVYLKNVDRMAVVGISRNGPPWMDQNGKVTGPYFWDPSKADPNKVSGLTGSQVNPTAFPDVIGGQMWQNRANAVIDSPVNGTTAYVNVGGKDVVYVTNQYDDILRYTVRDLNPANDTWEVIGKRPHSGETGWGSAAIDPARNIFLKTLTPGSFGFWGLDHPGTAEDNREIIVVPTFEAGLKPPDFMNFGVQYDPRLDAFVMWDGSADVWLLKPPTNLDPDGDGILTVGTGWRLEKISVSGAGPHIPTAYTGVYGKWAYMEKENAYIGVIDPVAGDVFLYKPLVSAVPENTSAMMMLAGVLMMSALIRRRHRSRTEQAGLLVSDRLGTTVGFCAP